MVMPRRTRILTTQKELNTVVKLCKIDIAEFHNDSLRLLAIKAPNIRIFKRRGKPDENN
jgi:hypothetical protein